MQVQPTAPSYSGEVTVSLGGHDHVLLIGINTLRDYSALTGSPAGGLAADLIKDYNNTLVSLVFVAVKRYTPVAQLPEAFSEEHVADWIDRMSEADAERLAATIIRNIKVGSPLTASLVAQLTPPTTPAAAETDGMTLLDSPSESSN